jgi:predicted  nucleic acid-binding Zn-ribbon protein
MKQSKSRKNLSVIAIIAILLLLLINGILLYDRASKDQEIREQQRDLSEIRQLQSELEKEYYEALAELDDMRTDNEELNTLIDQQKEELTKQRNRISNLIYENRNLEDARRELNQLREQVDQYLLKIDELSQENIALLEDRSRLETEKKQLTEEIASERKATDELMAVQQQLMQERELMDDEIKTLAKKVDQASVILVDNIEVEAFRLTDGGRERMRRSARNVDALRICFDTTPNDLVEFGDEAFFIRVISPGGETLAIESLGSGVIKDLSTSTQVRYTQMKTVAYDQEPQNVCVRWAPNLNFTSGNYQVYVYNKGYLAGESQFELR